MSNLPGQQSATTEAKNRFPKWIVAVAIGAILLLGAGAAWQGFLAWKERHLIRQARVFLHQNDLGAFSRKLDEVRKLDPKSVDAYRLYAQALAERGDPAALRWLRSAAQLANENLDDQMALAETAFAFKRNSEAARVLHSIATAAGDRADYHDLAGRLAQSSGKTEEAESHFAEAARLAPTNRSYQLHLATARLDSSDSTVRAKAQDDLEKLQAQPELTTAALRALVANAIKNNRLESAVTLAEKLDTVPNHAFTDRLTYLEILQQEGDSSFPFRLSETQEEASHAPDKILSLLGWMNTRHLALLAKDWAQRLPPEAIATTPIRIEIAQSYATAAAWKELRAFLANDNWGPFNFMKDAFLTRAKRGTGESEIASQASWTLAIKEAGDSSESLKALARMATEWGWEKEAIGATWEVALHSDEAQEAVRALCSYYFKKRDTEGLLRIYSLIEERNPKDSDARNNVALFSLLLGQDQGGSALETARELHEKEPANPVFASTYAFALHCHGKTGLALGVMGSLKPEVLRDPPVATYYSAILTAAGRLNEAQEFREAAKGARLLPEEERLLQTGTTGN